MQKIVSLIYKGIRRILISIRLFVNYIITWIILYGNNVQFKRFKSNGIPYINIARGGFCTIKNNFKMNNGNLGNPIGRPQRCILNVKKGATLTIGENVGMSSTALVVHQYISIGNNVKIGGGSCIYDTDFHSLNPNLRRNSILDYKSKKNNPVVIEDNVFIGAHATILKGVTIGKNSIIGACSVVTKNIPKNEIWAGNPAKFIKNV